MARVLLIVLVVAALPTVAGAASSDTIGRTTLERRVVSGTPGDGFTALTLGPGDPVVVREELAAAQAGREKRRRSLAYFAQLTDFQLADEESPARVELVDRLHSEVSGAWRPHEAVIPHMVDAAIRQVNAHKRSPFRQGGGRRARLGFAVVTGDNADNQQRNESRWVDTLLDGGTLDPNSGRVDDQSMRGAGCALASRAVLAAEAARYTGVQDYDDYGQAGTFYDPDVPRGQFAKWPLYPGLMDRAQRPFAAAGLDVPSYVALGNHDGLVQGNQAANAAFNGLATGCIKVMAPAVGPDGALAGLDASTLLAASEGVVAVPPDPDRREITKPEYRALFTGPGQSDAHGFAYVDADELDASRGAASYYDFSPAARLRVIALDTVSNAGVTGSSHKGNVDHSQFQWLQRKLEDAEGADELVVVLSHHAPVSLTSGLPDEIAGPCENRAVPEANANPGCDLDPRDSRPIHLGPELVGLLLEHPHVIAWVAGHSHVNDVAFSRRPDGTGGFWIVRTSAEADFPHQDRLLDIMDNRDGTLSIFGALLDNAAPATAAPPGTAAGGLTGDELASIGRTLGFNDPHSDPSAAGDGDDRNVELLVGDPRRARTVAGPRLRVTVRPKRVIAGRRTALRIRVTQGGSPVRGALVRVANRRARTDRRGRARIVVRLRRKGVRRVRSGGASTPLVVVRR